MPLKLQLCSQCTHRHRVLHSPASVNPTNALQERKKNQPKSRSRTRSFLLCIWSWFFCKFSIKTFPQSDCGFHCAHVNPLWNELTLSEIRHWPLTNQQGTLWIFTHKIFFSGGGTPKWFLETLQVTFLIWLKWPNELTNVNWFHCAHWIDFILIDWFSSDLNQLNWINRIELIALLRKVVTLFFLFIFYGTLNTVD